ncbi:MAG: CorA family divalent cation transporter [Gallionella sp.]
MQSDTEVIAGKYPVHGHLLADMREIGWEQVLLGDQTLLRLASPQGVELDALGKRFLLDELHIKDILNPSHPPQFTRLKNGALHIILRFPVRCDGEDETSEATSVSILADQKMCALIWPGERYHYFTNQELAGLSVEACVCKIIHMLVDYLLRRVYALREDMDEFEDECLADAGNADLGRLLLMRKEFAVLARYARTNALSIEKLREDSSYRENLRLADAHEHMQRASVIAESRAEHVLSLMQAVQSLLSQRLNQVLTFLAVITVILTPIGVIAGIFGMNFTNMEVLKNPNGFTFAILGMLLLGAALAIIFKIKKWW